MWRIINEGGLMQATDHAGCERVENPDTEPKAGRRRLDSSLESVGAEFLVLGQLLIEGIQAYKSYVNYPGFDIIATNPEKNTSCRIQVKSRWATDYDGGFPIRNFDCDFVVFAELNRGYRHKKQAQSSHAGRMEPRLFVFPVGVIKSAQNPASTWGKVFLRHIETPQQYLNNWGAIKAFLGMGES
jgi:hypothetical protein